MQLRALQRQAGHAGQLVAGVLEHVGQHGAQRLGALREHQAELGQQAADAVDQRGALFLVALAQAVHGELALLLGGLDRHEAHVRAAGGLADRGGVVGVVLAALAGHAVRRDEVAGDQPRVQPQQAQPARPVVCAAAGLHRHQAAGGQLGAPGEEAFRRHRLGQHHPARAVDRVHLDHALGQIHPYPRNRRSCNLRHDFPFPLRLNFRNSILVPRYRHRTGEVPSYSPRPPATPDAGPLKG